MLHTCCSDNVSMLVLGSINGVILETFCGIDPTTLPQDLQRSFWLALPALLDILNCLDKSNTISYCYSHHCVLVSFY